MALSQLFWDVLMPWNLKSTYFSLKMIHFLSLNIWYVIYVVFWIKYWNLKLPHHCILFLFTICTVSQLFWNRVCIYIYIYMSWFVWRKGHRRRGKYFFFVLIYQIEKQETQHNRTSEQTKTQGELRTYKHLERNQGELKQVVGIIKST